MKRLTIKLAGMLTVALVMSAGACHDQPVPTDPINPSENVCGDGVCSEGETVELCSSDCVGVDCVATPEHAACQPIVEPKGVCGNGECEWDEGIDGCPADCKTVKPDGESCPNMVCHQVCIPEAVYDPDHKLMTLDSIQTQVSVLDNSERYQITVDWRDVVKKIDCTTPVSYDVSVLTKDGGKRLTLESVTDSSATLTIPTKIATTTKAANDVLTEVVVSIVAIDGAYTIEVGRLVVSLK